MSIVFIISLIVFSLFKIFVSSAPSSVVEKITKRFQIHPTLDPKMTKVKYKDLVFLGIEKEEIVKSFNESNFLEKHYYAPEPTGDPLVIEVDEGKRNSYLYLYLNEDHILVFKDRGKKKVVYSIRSSELQQGIAS